MHFMHPRWLLKQRWTFIKQKLETFFKLWSQLLDVIQAVEHLKFVKACTSLYRTRSPSACYMVQFESYMARCWRPSFTFGFDLYKFCNFKVTCLKIFTFVFKGSMKIREMVPCYEEGNYSLIIFNWFALPIKSGVLTW